MNAKEVHELPLFEDELCAAYCVGIVPVSDTGWHLKPSADQSFAALQIRSCIVSRKQTRDYWH